MSVCWGTVTPLAFWRPEHNQGERTLLGRRNSKYTGPKGRGASKARMAGVEARLRGGAYRPCRIQDKHRSRRVMGDL